MDEIIKIEKVTKDYRIKERNEGLSPFEKAARFFNPKYIYSSGLKNLDLTVNKGDFVGLIGENGAGKTTAIKLMTGILTPTKGKVKALGLDPNRERKRYTSHIGVVMGQKSLLWYNIPVMESLKLYKEIYKVSDKDFEARIDFYKKIFNAEEILNKAVRQLSLGQRMRAELMASLIHKPEILFLDEPTIGLDVLSKNALHDHLAKINAEDKTTIILTSHDSNEIEKLCNRIVILKKGTKIKDTTVASLLKEQNENSLESCLLNLYSEENA